MPLQSSFGTSFATGFPGMVANAELSNRITRTIEDAGGIAFGKAAFQGAGDHGCTATPNAHFLGVVMVDHSLVRHTGIAADTFGQYENVPLFQRGTICVLASVNVAKGDPVYVTPAGLFTNVSNAGANTQLAGWLYTTTVAGGVVARISNNRS